MFKTCGIERVLIAYDRDSAGDNAASKLAVQLQTEGLGCYRLQFPKGMDANQYALEVTPAGKSLGIVIRSAQWLGNGAGPERSLEVEVVAKGDSPALAAPPPYVDEPIVESVLDTDIEHEVAPPAEALPQAPEDAALSIETKVSHKEISFNLGSRHYRVRGLDKNKNYEVLKVNVLVSAGELLHVDTLDLYHAKARQSYIKVAALELAVEESVIKKDIGRVLLKLEGLQEQLIQGSVVDKAEPALSKRDQEAALSLLRDSNVLARIVEDFEACGIVGERINTLVGYLAASSRKLQRPLAVMIQSSSAAGKSSLMDAILNLMPEAERVQYSAMTGQSLFYMGESNLKHKILAISEEAGAEQASYALKLLQSEGEITIASTGKDEASGELVTRDYRVEGPVMLFLTTTAIDIDEELLNRCLVLSVNESRQQTQAIHTAQRQRRMLEGLQLSIEREQIIKVHRDAQSC